MFPWWNQRVRRRQRRSQSGQFRRRLTVECFEERCAPSATRFGVIGDFGLAGVPEANVATLVKSWNPDLIITLGDNNYPSGSAATIDANIGQYYHDYIGNYVGSYGAGSAVNRFFPTLGNHDWETRSGTPPLPTPYLDYFTLPGNERYYTFTQGPVQFFALDSGDGTGSPSDGFEPDGFSSTSVQAQWLQSQLAASTAPWKLVYLHHPPYSSGAIGNTTMMQWPFQAWGATAVLAGDDHDYERLSVGGFPYFVNGAGGDSLQPFGTTVAGSQIRYNGDFGAMRVDATDTSIRFQFITRTGTLIDNYTIDKPVAVPSVMVAAADTTAAEPRVKVFDSVTGALSFSILAYNANFRGGVRVATGDITGDGVADIITAAGPGGGPHVKAFDGKSGGEVRSFFAYSAAFTGGVYVAAGDVNDDGFDDIITGADAGGGPHVIAFSGKDGSILHSFYAYDASFKGGVRVAAGDINGSGTADIITGAGPSGGPHVKAFSGGSGALMQSFFAYAPGFTGGVYVAAGNLDGNGRADIITGAGRGGGPHVKVFDGATLALQASFFAYDAAFRGGVRVGVADIGNGALGLVTGAGPAGGPHVKVFNGTLTHTMQSLYAFDPSFLGGVFVG